jgi:hypothetical protein
MKTAKRKEFENLLSLIGDRALSDQEFQQLNDLMKAEEGWAEEYYDHCHIQGLLQEKNDAFMDFNEIEKLIDEKAPAAAPKGKKFPVWIMAVAACLAIALVINFKKTPQVDFVAQLKTGLNYELLDANGRPVQIGDRLKGHYSLKKGLAEFVYGIGVKVIVEAPAEIDMIAFDTIGLSQGKIYALTPPGAKGFTVTTPKAVFNDLGTEFAVEYFDNKDATLEVYKGKVQAITNEGLEKILTAGMAIKLSRSGKIKDSPIREDYFVRELPTLTEPYQQMILAHAPVVYLPMETEQDSFFNYSAFSPGKAHGDLNAAVPGFIGQAFQTNQQNYLRLDSYPKASDFLTVMGWIKITENASGIMARNGEGKGQFELHLEQGYLKATIHNRHGIPVMTSLANPLEVGKWHHVALTYDGGQIILYHNSKLTAAKTNNEGLYSENLAPFLSIGSGSPNTLSFNGLVDEFAIFNKALSRADIKKLYQESQK